MLMQIIAYLITESTTENIYTKMMFITRKINFQSVRRLSTKRNVQEVRIPLPQGYLAGKWWGPLDKRPIVAFHGWQDNCGSFDRLIPLLPEHIPVLALDCPGHGYSYKLPPGIPYRNADSAIMMKQIVNYFGWNKLTLMGHSLGAIISYMFGQLFPNDVDFIICIDGLHPLINPKGLQVVARSVTEFLKYDALQQSNEESPCYTFEEMINRLHLATRKSIALQTAKYILTRNIAESKTHPGKYYFSRDARLKVGPLEVPCKDDLIKIAANITFPIFVTKAAHSPFFGSESVFKEILPIIKKSSSDCQFHEVPGTHHGHLNEPDIVAKLISDFIKKHDTGNRNINNLKTEIFNNSEKVKAVQL